MSNLTSSGSVTDPTEVPVPTPGAPTLIPSSPADVYASCTVSRTLLSLPDSRTLESVVRVYDDASRLTREDIDLFGDGVWDTRVLFDYGASGRPLTIQTDQWIDGSIDSLETRYYDSAGRWVTTVTDVNGDGAIDRLSHYEYISTRENPMIVHRQFTASDPATQTVEVFKYDLGGHIISRTLTPHNSATQLTSYSWHDERISHIEIDSTSDGRPDDVISLFYDPRNLLTEYRADFKNDRIVDIRSLFAYDSRGWLTFRRDQVFEESGEVVINYDSRGRIISERSQSTIWLQSNLCSNL